MQAFRNLSLASRMTRLSCTVILAFVLLIFWLFCEFRNDLYAERKNEVRNLVEASWHILDEEARRAADGGLSTTAAQQEALRLIARQRFDGKNYFWISNREPRMLMHPRQPQLDGRLLGDYRDADGHFPFREMARIAREKGDGYLEYQWANPGDPAPQRKISYVKGLPQWGWIIGAGFYLQDINRHLLHFLLIAGGVLLLVVGGTLLLVYHVTAGVARPARQVVGMIEALERGDLGCRLHLDRDDEIGRMARALDTFADHLQHEILSAFEHLARGDFSFAAQGLIREPLARTNHRLNALVADLHEAAALAQSEHAKCEAMIAALDHGIAIFDLDRRIRYQNCAHREALGELNGLGCPHCGGVDECAVAKALESGRVEHVEHRLMVNGRVLYMESTASPVLDPDGEIATLIEVARDITARKQAEEHLVRGERLRAIGQMASGVAHDINNSLVGVLGFTDFLLASPAERGDAARVTEYLQKIKASASGATEVVRRLREFYRPSGLRLDLEPLDLAQLVRKVVELTQPRWRDQARSAGLAIRVGQHHEGIAAIRGCASELQELMTNLIFNAADALELKFRGGGDGETAEAVIEVETRKEGDEVVFRLTDNGIGMSAEVRRSCLEPFFTTKGEEGSGLGLAIAQSVVQRHGGHLDITSQPGAGTTFTLRFPQARAPLIAVKTEPVAAAAAPTARLRVLLVEDEESVRQVFTDYLHLAGHEVITATNGSDALRRFDADGPFDLVVTDHSMPGMNGRQLAARLREQAPAIRVILVSGFGDLVAGGSPGEVDYVLGKPATFAHFREAIAAVVAA